MLNRITAFIANQGRSGLLVRALIGSAGIRIFGMACGFLVGVQLARGLGPAGYGLYGIAMSIFSLLMLPTEFGLPQLVTREVAAANVAEDKQLLNSLLGWSAKFIILTSIVLAIIGIPFLLWDASLLDKGLLNKGLHQPLAWGLLLLPLVAAGNIASSALRGLHRIIEGQISELVLRPGLLSLLLIAFSIIFGAVFLTPSIAMALNVVTALIGAIYACYCLNRYAGFDPRVPLFGEAGLNWLSSSIPLAMGDGMRIISGQLAVLVLGVFATTTDVGIYRVAFGIYAVATLPSALLNAACSPMLSTFNQEGRLDAIQRLNAWMAIFLIVSAIVCLLPFVIAGKQIIVFVFGASYAGSTEILMILLVGELFAAFIGHPTIVLNMMKHEKVVVWSSVLALTANLLLCFSLVPQYGAKGAAIGVALSQVVWRLSASYYAFTRLQLNTTVFAWVAPKGKLKNG